MRRGAWVEVIKKHTVSVEHQEQIFIKTDDLSTDSVKNVEIVKGVVRISDKYDRDGKCFLEFYTQTNVGMKGQGGPRSNIFPAQFVDLSSEDVVILYHQYRYNDETNSVSYIPWDQIVAIQYVSIEEIKS